MIAFLKSNKFKAYFDVLDRVHAGLKASLAITYHVARRLEPSENEGIVKRGLSVVCGAVGLFFLFGGAGFAANGSPITSTTSNAPGVLVDGTNVSLYVPYSTDNSLKMGTALKVIESATGTLPKAVRLGTGYANSCAASPATEIAVCSTAFGNPNIIRPPKNKVAGFKTGASKLIHFTGGSCATCGVAIDDGLGQAIVATSKGYLPVQLSPLKLQPIIATGGDVISGNFGYDPVDHLILSPNYQIVNLKTFQSTKPDYQILRPSDGAAFDLADGSDFFSSTGTCTTNTGGTTQRDALPDSGAYDAATQIAYGTFRSPSDCVPDVVEDIALFDLSQATFDTTSNTWTTPGKQIQTLSEMTNLENGITGIAIVPGQQLALVADRFELSGGGGGFGALSLPTTSGSGVPAIQDWVQAEMPSDPSGKPWAMSYEPNGLTAYTSPNTGKGMGVIINRARTYAAVIDIAALLAAPRQQGTSHTLNSSVVLTPGIVSFVNIQPGK